MVLYKTGLQLSEEKNKKKSANVIRFSFIPEDKTIRDREAKGRIEMEEGWTRIADSVCSSIPAKQGH